MKQYRVLKPLPQGQQPGETIELADEFAKVLLLVEAVEPVPPPPEPPKPRSRQNYRKAELTAADVRSEELTAKE